MLTMFKNWSGSFEINGTVYDSFDKIPANLEFKAGWTMKLLPAKKNSIEYKKVPEIKSEEIRITVKRYMTQKADPNFDFMAKWNHDNPMPLRTMTGIKIKETPGMVYMKLHGDIYAEKICTCMKCGKNLTNPVSQYFGIGPECGGHNYVNPFNSDEELKEAVSAYKAKLRAIEWEGWIIKSAITEQEEA